MLALTGLALAGRPRVPLRTRGAAMRVVSETKACTEIFCNRAINMAHIQAVGFDMDYTLAEYCSETFDLLAYDGAVDKLVGMGYPEAVCDFEYDPNAYQRGLVLDKKRGNVLKMDRHKYVKVAYHGLTRLNSAERKAIYASSFETQVQSFVPPDYASVDTEFMLVDLALFCQLVDHKDRHPEEITQSYAQIAKDIRHAVDLCHCDGVIKDRVAADPAKYIKPNPELPLLFERLRAGGKQIFILTNSLYDFTNVVMSFLLGDDWKDHLDLVICGACSTAKAPSQQRRSSAAAAPQQRRSSAIARRSSPQLATPASYWLARLALGGASRPGGAAVPLNRIHTTKERPGPGPPPLPSSGQLRTPRRGSRAQARGSRASCSTPTFPSSTCARTRP